MERKPPPYSGLEGVECILQVSKVYPSGSPGQLPWGGVCVYAGEHACVHVCLLRALKTQVLTVWSQVHATLELWLSWTTEMP